MVPQEGELVTATTTEGEEYAEHAQMDRPHVFVINSDPSFLDLVRELLQEERYNVTTTNLVPRTFDQIAALRPSVLVVDLAFGQRAGWELLERLQDAAVTRLIPVMVVSTDARLLAEADAQRQRYGGGLFLAKPFDIEEMLRGIRLLTGEARGSAAFGGLDGKPVSMDDAAAGAPGRDASRDGGAGGAGRARLLADGRLAGGGP